MVGLPLESLLDSIGICSFSCFSFRITPIYDLGIVKVFRWKDKGNSAFTVYTYLREGYWLIVK